MLSSFLEFHHSSDEISLLLLFDSDSAFKAQSKTEVCDGFIFPFQVKGLRAKHAGRRYEEGKRKW
jgi:hypothetical protein